MQMRQRQSRLSYLVTCMQICDNIIDEGFRNVQTRIKSFVKDWLLDWIRSLHPLKSDATIKQMMREHIHGLIQLSLNRIVNCSFSFSISLV